MMILELLLLLVIANGIPIIARKACGGFLAFPVDGHLRLADGQPLFGPAKTIRGVVLAVIVTGGCANLLGLGWRIGLVVGITAMLGDLVASFIKRRLKKPPSSRAFGLDQVLESLFPALACTHLLSLSALDVVIVVASFTVIELLLSRLLYRWHIRAEPY